KQKRVEEIRLHCGRRATLTSAGRNILTSAVLTRQEMDRTLTRLCEGSVYAFRDTIAEGYIGLRGGVRVGVCGRAALSGGKICGVYDIDTLVIRIPHPSPPLGSEIAELIRKNKFTGGVLIYSPPGVGKTTLLRSLAKILASGERAVRVSVIDTRGELGYSLGERDLCVDILSGYPKHTGISIAARTLSPQVIICDEIGSRAEAEAICEAQGCGVPLIATAHASSVRELLGRSGMGILHRSGCFLNYVGISRSGEFGLSYDVCKREDADIAYL
ncbi:MAG: AAA family ATPase, partial [Clostridia bacterium]|nr:AAA family ATPase [Clostridia bacterium]